MFIISRKTCSMLRNASWINRTGRVINRKVLTFPSNADLKMLGDGRAGQVTRNANYITNMLRLSAAANRNLRSFATEKGGQFKPPGGSKSSNTKCPNDSKHLKPKGPPFITEATIPKSNTPPKVSEQGSPSITEATIPKSNTSPKVSDKEVPPFCGADSQQGFSSSIKKNDTTKPTSSQDSDGGKTNKNGKIIGGVIILLAAGLGTLYWLDVFGDKESKKKKGISSKTKEPRVIVKNPASSSEIPNKIPYLLIGGGTASFAAFRAIKSSDAEAKVLVITSDPHFPYMRPPLSKEIWYSGEGRANDLKFTQWNGLERSVYFEPPEFYTDVSSLSESAHGGVAVARGWTVKKLDISEKKAYLDDGYAINYDKCLIATGATPRKLNIFENAPENVKDKIMTYRGVFDFEEVHEELKRGAKSVAIVGGNFLGSELACSLAQHIDKHKLEVHQIFRESGNMGKVFPEYLSLWTTNKIREEGVKVYNNAEVKSVSLDNNSVVLSLSTGEKVKADKVIAAVGVEPNTELAGPSKLEVHKEHGGFLVNAELMARTDVWVAGDCSCFYDPKLGRRRVEHHDHAVVSGRLAGENMTGAGKEYWHQSMFWSDLGPEVGFEAIGIVDSSLPTVGVFAKASEGDSPKAVVTATNEGDRSKVEENAAPVTPSKTVPDTPKTQDEYGKGVIFYLRDDIIVGILLWNVFSRMNVARQVLQEGKKFEDLNEVAKLFNIHEQ